MLTGEVNPSGRLVDTYAYDVSSAPASENFGDYKYDNLDGMAFINYEEGIYIGYRYYETRYADDETGYWNAVQYPFGYGLSYTEFDWETVKFTVENEMVTWQVKVTNTGDSEVLTLSFPVRDLSSYDMITEEAYVLEEGTYEIKLARNVHDIVEVQTYEVTEKVVYDTDEVTGTPIEKRFDYADGGLTYLSRSDWAGTYPTDSDTNYTASGELLSAMDAYNNPAPSSAASPPQGRTTASDWRISAALPTMIPSGSSSWTSLLTKN